MKSRRVIILLLIVCQASASTFAQWRSNGTGFNYNNPMSSLAATMVMNKAREDALAKRLGVSNSGNQSSTEAQAQAPTKQIDESVLRFRSTGTYLKTKELADQISTDPSQREICLKIMNGVLDAFGQQTQRLGLANDIAAALAFFFGENIRIYRGAPELSDHQYVSLRNTIASALIAGGGFGSATDQQKQEMYEILVASTGFTQFAYEQALQANKAQLATQYQKVAGSNLQALTKVSPDSISLTSDGLNVR